MDRGGVRSTVELSAGPPPPSFSSKSREASFGALQSQNLVLWLLDALSSANFSGLPACLCQRMSAPQSALITCFQPASSNRLGGPGRGAVGPWHNVLSMCFKAASAADEVRFPTRSDAGGACQHVNYHHSPCATPRLAVFLRRTRALANWWHRQRHCAQPSSATWCAAVAAARRQFGLNPRNGLGQMGATAHACMRSSTRLGLYARACRCSRAPIRGRMGASFVSGRPPLVAHDVGGGDDNLF